MQSNRNIAREVLEQYQEDGREAVLKSVIKVMGPVSGLELKIRSLVQASARDLRTERDLFWERVDAALAERHARNNRYPSRGRVLERLREIIESGKAVSEDC